MVSWPAIRKVRSYAYVEHVVRRKVNRKAYVVTDILNREPFLCDGILSVKHDIEQVLLFLRILLTLRNDCTESVQYTQKN